MGSIGSKVKRIRIEQAVQTEDAQGGHTTSWALRCVADAHERPLNGREALQAQQVTATHLSVWEIWQTAETESVSVKDRIRFKSRTIEIEDKYDATDTREEWTLLCSEVQS